MILDSQSTCDVTINKDFISNVRHCKCALHLQTQEGECRVNQIEYLAGVGSVLNYPEGIANILSQYIIYNFSKWRISHNRDIFHETGRAQCL